MDHSPVHPGMMETSVIFEAGHTIAWAFLSAFIYPWEALPGIGGCIAQTGASLSDADYEILPDNVWIHRTATVAKSAHIGSNVIISAGAEIRH